MKCRKTRSQHGGTGKRTDIGYLAPFGTDGTAGAGVRHSALRGAAGHSARPGGRQFCPDRAGRLLLLGKAPQPACGVQNKLARLINRSNIGLNASVSEDSLGNTALNIESDMTGVSVIKPTIFNIRPNNDIQTDNPDFVEGFDEPTMEKNTNFIETYGLDRVTQYPGNAIFSVNGVERSSASNDITINKTFAISFHNTTDKPATISLKDDADSITESITELVSGYNRLVSIAADKENDKFEGNAKLKKEFSRIMMHPLHIVTAQIHQVHTQTACAGRTR